MKIGPWAVRGLAIKNDAVKGILLHPVSFFKVTAAHFGFSAQNFFKFIKTNLYQSEIKRSYLLLLISQRVSSCLDKAHPEPTRPSFNFTFIKNYF